MRNIKASVAYQPFAQEERARESRLALALLRGVIENLKPNRLMMPLFAAAVCAMFSPWVSIGGLALWYAVVLAGLVPQLLVSRMIPAGILSVADTEKWMRRGAIANLLYVMAWTSLGWLLWTPGSDFNHLLIQLVLATTLTAHAALVGPCRAVALPAFCWYGVVMTLVPLQAHATVYYYLAGVTPFYVGYVAAMARQHHTRARAALVLAEERNGLLAELVCAKLESDRGRERAEAASLAKSQFLANMSHELRTPLNAIIGFSDIISQEMLGPISNAKYVEYCHDINNSGSHLLSIINEILDLAKAESGKLKLQEGETDILACIDEAFRTCGPAAEKSGIALKLAPRHDDALVLADRRFILQIVLNLVSNAVKFTPRGGTVEVSVRAGDDGIAVAVRDTGIGIPEDNLERVMRPFEQVENSYSRSHGGTGLGLPYSAKLAELHDGAIRLESVLHQGTVATLWLPAARLITVRTALRAVS